VGASLRVHVYQGDDDFWCWHLKADNGEIVSDSAEGYRHKGYCITMAEKLNPNAKLVIDGSVG
jgi:uncharacterized protein YegP (UPF0339 family)